MVSEEFIKFGKVIFHTIEKCPHCYKESLEVYEVLYSIPNFGNVLLISNTCSNCGFKFVDLQYLEQKKYYKIMYSIEDKRDIYETLIFRSKTCKISSPELGFNISPGIASEPMITTIEGLLNKVKDYAITMYVLNEDVETKNKVIEFLETIDKALKGEIKFTIILEDPLGNSAIKPPTGRENRLIMFEQIQ